MSECSGVQEEGTGGGATLQTMTRYYFIIYGTNFAMAGRRFSDSAPLEARIKLPSAGWIKTLITSGDIYWTAFEGVRTGSRRPPRFTSAHHPRPFLGLPPPPPLPPSERTFVSDGATIVSLNNGSYHFYEGDFELSQADNSAALVA